MPSWRRAACSNTRQFAAPESRGLRLTLWQPLVYVNGAFVGTPTGASAGVA
jgi:hypothetical protein